MGSSLCPPKGGVQIDQRTNLKPQPDPNPPQIDDTQETKNKDPSPTQLQHNNSENVKQSIAIKKFKKWGQIDNIESNYHFSASVSSKTDLALCTKVGGEFNQKYMIKTISKSKNLTPQELKQIQDQIRLQQAGFEGVSRVIEALETKENYYIVQEHTEGGDLVHKMIIVDTISEKNCAFIISQIVHVLEQLHEKKGIHRNLNPANIIFQSNNKDNFQLTVQGFDYASSFTNTNIQANLAELQFLPPEVIDGKIGDSKVDIWALGVLAYLIIQGVTPFLEEKDEETRKAISNSPVKFEQHAWESVSSICKDFIKKCLNKDPAHRPSADELIEDPFIKSGTQH